LLTGWAAAVSGHKKNLDLISTSVPNIRDSSVNAHSEGPSLDMAA